MPEPLEREFKFYLAHQEDFLRQYKDKYVVIRGEEVIGAYDDELAAIRATEKTFPLGTFLVQKVEPGEKGYSQTYHSRVAFS